MSKLSLYTALPLAQPGCIGRISRSNLAAPLAARPRRLLHMAAATHAMSTPIRANLAPWSTSRCLYFKHTFLWHFWRQEDWACGVLFGALDAPARTLPCLWMNKVFLNCSFISDCFRLLKILSTTWLARWGGRTSLSKKFFTSGEIGRYIVNPAASPTLQTLIRASICV